MKIRDINKLVAIVLIVGATSFLSYAGVIASEGTIGILGAIVGYVLGNTHGVMENKQDIKKLIDDNK